MRRNRGHQRGVSVAAYGEVLMATDNMNTILPAASDATSDW